MIRIDKLMCLLVASAVAAPVAAHAQSVEVAPPAAYIATSEPEYYDNRPVYYYHDNWYYRDRGRWSHYGDEPGYLRDRRARWGADRGDARGGGGGGGGRGFARTNPHGRFHYRR